MFSLLFLSSNPCGFSNHSFRSGGATAAANLNVPDRLFKVHGTWKSDSANDGYVCDKVDLRLLVPLNIVCSVLSDIKTLHVTYEY